MSAQLAIDGGEPLRREPFPHWPQWSGEEQEALLAALESGEWWSMGGQQVDAFAREFAAAHDAHYGVCCTNGSAALEICLRAAGLEWGDEVITTSYSFVATANAALLVGAIPRFADVLPDTWNLDPAHVEALITPRTRAIIAVHIGGEPADMDALTRLAQARGLVLIEDAAQAHGAAWRGRRVGAIGDMGTFSFQNSKNITAGEGGIILSNRADWHERCWSVVNVGRRPDGGWYEHVGLASNYRPTEWQAAVLRAQLPRLWPQNAMRQRHVRLLAKGLAQIGGLTALPGDPRVTDNAYHLLKLRYDPDAFGCRPAAEFVRAARAEGVPFTRGYPAPFGREPMIRRETERICRRLDLPVPDDGDWPHCQQACDDGLWLLHSVLLGNDADMEDILAVVDKIKRAWTN
ncbi:MAG: DegT/DnrJ/EryC1/StrS family aminotransferase [Anaerolineae bacterium]|jgi:dTDP-4-amino-4,6-dideoxygalactose transaminase